jgi:hypothetical protein
MITVWCGYNAEQVKQFVAASGYKWHQVAVQGTWARAPQRFMVRALPATFVIGGNRKVLARNPKDDELKLSVDSLLGLGDLFAATQGEPPPRYPLTKFDVAEAPPLAGEPALAVLDDTDQRYDARDAGDDRLRLLAADGKELWSQGGFRNAPYGGAGGVAVDRQRGRIYVRENQLERVTALNLMGQKLWQVDQVSAATLALDEKTGNLWVASAAENNEGETVVLNPEGRDVAAFPFPATNIVYDPHSDAFWLVGQGIIKLSRDGQLLYRTPTSPTMAPSLAVNPKDGSMWHVEYAHPQMPDTKNRLTIRNPDGTARKEIELGKEHALAIAFSPQDDAAWVAFYNVGVRRVSANGEISEPSVPAARNVAVGPNGDVWVATEEAVIRLDASGREAARSPFHTRSNQAWMAAF